MPQLTEFDLHSKVMEKVELLGTKEAATFFNKSESIIKKWQATTGAPTIMDAQKVLNEVLESGEGTLFFPDAPEQGLTKPAADVAEPERIGGVVSDGSADATLTLGAKVMEGRKKIRFMTPINRDMSFAVVLSMLGNWKASLPVELRAMLAGMDFEPDANVHRARNILATNFMRGEAEWAVMMDSDIIAPVGNAAWFKRRTGSSHDNKWFERSALERLMSRGKTLIGAVYSERGNKGRICASIGMSPTGDGDRKVCDDIKMNGPQDEVIPVNWIGFGFVLIHRSVFQAMIDNLPGVKPADDKQPFNFFNAIEGGPQGEDSAFCKRAAEVGHPAFLDLAVHCGHVGKFAFMP